MFEKILHPIFAAFSLLIHFTLICCIISIPVFLIYQGDCVPTFTAEVGEVTHEENVPAALASSQGEDADGCSVITFNCTADAGRYNPYTFTVGGIEADSRNPVYNNYNCVVECDTLEFKGGPEKLSFTITVYVDADVETAESIAPDLSFHTTDTSEGFSAISALIVNGYRIYVN